MSSNHSGQNGNVCSSFNQHESLYERANVCKWRRGLLLMWLMLFPVFVWILFILADGKLGSEVETLLMTRDASQDSSICNASMEKVASLTCCSEAEIVMPPWHAVTCALKILGSKNWIFDRQSKLVTENMEFGAYCSSSADAHANSLGIESSEETSASFFRNATLPSLPSEDPNCKKQMRELHYHATDNCEGTYIRSAEICLWILTGIAICYILHRLYDKLRSPKHEMRQNQTLLQQQVCSSSRSSGKWRKKLLVFFVLGGGVTSFWLFWYLNEDIMLRRKETLASMCDERARMLQDQFNVSMNHVHALAILISTFLHGKQPSAMDQKTFEDYTEMTAFERPLTSGVAYALRVRQFEREQVEKQYGWTIKKMDIEDQTLAQDCIADNFTTSPIQDEYAPVIFSQKTVSHIVSIDMMSGKEDRENILRARASGKGVLTSPFKLLKSNHLGVVLTFAVYSTNVPLNSMPEERINATVGYLGASYDVPSLVEKLLHQLASKQTIIVNVYDTTSQHAPIKMYGTDVADAGMLHISHLDFGDPTRKHEMHCRFKQKPPPPWQAITASVGLLVITLLTGHIFQGAINQITRAEHGYQKMMELKHRAEAADVAKSQFLATVSHEIRTPMNGVLGMIQMLMDTNLDSCQLNYAQTAHDSGEDLISLINKVLDQAKIESGRLELEAVPFDPRAVLDKVLSIFSGKSHEKGIELAVYVSDKVPEVIIGDQERFGQIIINLVGNSIKFTHDNGHIFVSVHLADEVKSPLNVEDDILQQSLNAVQDASFNTLSGFRVLDRWRSWEQFENVGGSAEESGKIKLLVTVEDTGTGIPPEAQERIFMPFMQADSSTSRKYGGTGIGLSISKRLVDLMGGEIGFVSKLDIGSTFTFTVTLSKAETSCVEKMQPLCDPAILEYKGLKALVIDRKITRAQVTRYHLQRLGISVDIASSMESPCSYFVFNSTESDSIAESKQYAMVLVDQEDWDETCLPFHNMIKTIRHDGSHGKPRFPLNIFLLVTSISSRDRNKLKLGGFVDLLITKPLRLSSLLFAFQEATGKRLNTSDKPSTLRSLLNGKHILVVDDNAVNRRVAEGAMKKYGAVVTCVEGGKFAVELLKPPHDFDACFMDLQMPEMDGFKATVLIRSHEDEYNQRITDLETSWHTPILAMTADVSQATNEACMRCGMDDYISKPFGEGQLYSAVARFFEA